MFLGEGEGGEGVDALFAVFDDVADVVLVLGVDGFEAGVFEEEGLV